MPTPPVANTSATPTPRDYEKELADLLDVAKTHNALIPMEPDVTASEHQLTIVRWVSSTSEDSWYANP